MTVAAELDDRIGKCKKILTTDPNSQIFAALAEALRKKGDLDKAFQTCQNGLKVHPNYGAAHTIMAKINLDRGQHDWAEAELKRARELDGPSRATDVLLAEIFIYKGTFEEAIRILKKLLEGDPGSEHIKKLFDIAEQIPLEQEKEAEEKLKSSTEGTEIFVTEHAPIGSSSSLDDSVVGDTADDQFSSEDLIKASVSIKGITGAMLVNHEGLVLESGWNAEIDRELCASTLMEVSKKLNSDLASDSFGDVSWILIEAQGETIQLVRNKQGTFIFLGTAKINLGPMRMKLTELFDRYKE